VLQLLITGFVQCKGVLLMVCCQPAVCVLMRMFCLLLACCFSNFSSFQCPSTSTVDGCVFLCKHFLTIIVWFYLLLHRELVAIYKL